MAKSRERLRTVSGPFVAGTPARLIRPCLRPGAGHRAAPVMRCRRIPIGWGSCRHGNFHGAHSALTAA